MERNIIFPSIEEIIKINKDLSYSPVDKGQIGFILTKVESMKKSKDFKKDLSKIAARLWIDIITGHPFIDGNKRTATEVMKLFLKLNNYKLSIPRNGIIYISLKIVNKDLDLNKLTNYIYERIEKS